MQRSRLTDHCRLLALAMLMLALWNPHWIIGAPSAPLVLLDESASMTLGSRERPAERLRRWLEREHDLTGIRLLRFGATPSPIVDVHRERRETLSRNPAAGIDGSATNIELALRQALDAADPNEPILLLTDGIETRGDATPLLRRAQTAGRSIHLLDPDEHGAVGSAWIESIDLPPVALPGERFDAVVTMTSPVAQRVEVTVYHDEDATASASFDLRPGRTARSLTLHADAAAAMPLRFVLRGGATSGSYQDTWHDVVNVHGKAVVAYVTGDPAPALLTSLTHGGWPVRRATPGRLSSILEEAAVVVLDDVPVRAASDDDWSALVEAVRHRGVGLVVLGGTHAFGAGGYRGSRLESILPVTAEAGVPLEPAAVLFLLDRSGSMERAAATGTRIQHARQAVLDTIADLDPADQVGVVAFHAGAEVLMPLAAHADPAAAARQVLGNVQPNGGTRLAAGLELAVRELAASTARQRLLVLVTDGFTGTTDLTAVTTAIDALGIDVIAITVGDSADLRALHALTAVNRGVLLTPDDATRLPRLIPAAVGARRLTVESGIEAVLTGTPTLHLPPDLAWPAVDGFAVTRARPSTSVHLRTPRGDPLLASHRAGLGTVLALPAGLGRFARRWPGWQSWSVFAGGLVEWAAGVRWSERARVQIEQRADGLHLLLDTVGEQRDWLPPDAAAVSAMLTVPGGRPQAIALAAAAPGRFEAPLPVSASGRHRLAIDVAGQRVHHDFVPHSASERSLRESRLEAWVRDGLLRPWPPAYRQPSTQSLRIPLIVAALLVYACMMIGNFAVPTSRSFR